jgi:hypothetical protein
MVRIITDLPPANTEDTHYYTPSTAFRRTNPFALPNGQLTLIIDERHVGDHAESGHWDI